MLESFHGRPNPDTIDVIWPWLGHDDPWIRNAARVALEWQPVDEWVARVRPDAGDLGSLTALLALVRQAEPGSVSIPVSSALDADIPVRNRTGQLTLLRSCELLLRRGFPEIDDSDLPERIATRITPWARSPSREVRHETIRLLALLDRPEAAGLGIALLRDASTQQDRLHYLEMLSHLDRGWENEADRLAFFHALVHARDTAHGDRSLPAYLEGIQARALSAIEPSRQEEYLALWNTPRREEPLPEARAFVRNWSLEDFDDKDFNRLDELRDSERGARLFQAALCSRCHAFDRFGRPGSGPDLTQAGSRFSSRDLLLAILDPSRVVAEGYRNAVVSLRDGSTAIGRVMRDDFRESTLHIAPDPFSVTETISVAKGQIVSTEFSPASPMPPGLLNTLEKEEVLALLAFLRSGGR